MWKYVSRRIKDSFERGSNYFDVRGTVGATSQANNNVDQNNQVKVLAKDFLKTTCTNEKKSNGSNTNKKYWYYDYHFILQKWFGAITLSSALVVGWYANQILHLRRKCCINNEHKQAINLSNIIAQNLTNFKWSLGCCASIQSQEHIELEAISKSGSTVTSESLKSKLNLHLVTNDKESSGSSDNGFCDVLNSIENRLGLAAIENGQHQDGLTLLKSAAKRNHPPALYNLALCYENGLGLPANEQMAMELYRSAAMLEHPSALYNLAVYYGQGRGGLKPDLATAERLLRIAAVKGQEDAIRALKDFDTEPEISQQTGLYTQNDIANSLVV